MLDGAARRRSVAASAWTRARTAASPSREHHYDASIFRVCARSSASRCPLEALSAHKLRDARAHAPRKHSTRRALQRACCRATQHALLCTPSRRAGRSPSGWSVGTSCGACARPSVTRYCSDGSMTRFAGFSLGPSLEGRLRSVQNQTDKPGPFLKRRLPLCCRADLDWSQSHVLVRAGRND
mgnify:CR=1 FL=1